MNVWGSERTGQLTAQTCRALASLMLRCGSPNRPSKRIAAFLQVKYDFGADYRDAIHGLLRPIAPKSAVLRKRHMFDLVF